MAGTLASTDNQPLTANNRRLTVAARCDASRPGGIEALRNSGVVALFVGAIGW